MPQEPIRHPGILDEPTSAIGMPLVDGGLGKQSLSQSDTQEVLVEGFVTLVVSVPILIGGIDYLTVAFLPVLWVIAAGVVNEIRWVGREQVGLLTLHQSRYSRLIAATTTEQAMRTQQPKISGLGDRILR